jgi:hypothetical protein
MQSVFYLSGACGFWIHSAYKRCFNQQSIKCWR